VTGDARDGPPAQRSARESNARLTARGARTRARLVSAARALFEERGYLATGVNDISAAAGVAYGTFYIYFASKDEVFGEVVDELHRQVREIAAAEPHLGSDPASLIERANRGFFRAYRETAAMEAVA